MDQQFSLSWNNFHGNLTKGFAGLLGKGEFVDVTIAVEGHLLQAHKVILSICSPYFKKMFQLNPCQHPIVVLRDVSHKAMLALLQFMYHGEVSVQRHELTAFISTAEVLQVKGLTNKETEEESEKEPESNPAQEVSRNENESQSTTPNTPLSCVSQPQDTIHNETAPNESDLTKQRQFIEKLQRLSNLKRKSEEYLQKNYYSDLSCVDKRPKTVDHIVHPKPMHQLLSANTYEALKNLYDDLPLNITKGYNTLQRLNSKEMDDKCMDRIPDIELKTECEEDSVTDPVVCTTPKHYDGSREKELQLPLDYQTPRDNCTGLNSLFLDLKNLVNGKMGNVPVPNTLEEYSRQNLEHRLITIPQKEDGKKKYPQRSCRLCWKLGKRRDTRFMCNACDMPFCKTPCFEVHYNDIVKLPQFQGDYYAT